MRAERYECEEPRVAHCYEKPILSVLQASCQLPIEWWKTHNIPLEGHYIPVGMWSSITFSFVVAAGAATVDSTDSADRKEDLHDVVAVGT